MKNFENYHELKNWVTSQVENYDISCYKLDFDELTICLSDELEKLLIKRNFEYRTTVFFETIPDNLFLGWKDNFITEFEWEQIQDLFAK